MLDTVVLAAYDLGFGIMLGAMISSDRPAVRIVVLLNKSQFFVHDGSLFPAAQHVE